MKRACQLRAIRLAHTHRASCTPTHESANHPPLRRLESDKVGFDDLDVEKVVLDRAVIPALAKALSGRDATTAC